MQAMLCVLRRPGVDFPEMVGRLAGEGSGSVRRTEPSFRKVPSSGLQSGSRAPERGVSVLPASRTLLTPPHSSAPRLTPA